MKQLLENFNESKFNINAEIASDDNEKEDDKEEKDEKEEKEEKEQDLNEKNEGDYEVEQTLINME